MMGKWRRVGDGVVVYLLAAAFFGLAAGLIDRPGYMDADYYFNGAVRLARGFGFTEPYVWNYFSPVRALPAPSHLYWMPLTSLAAAPAVWLAEAWAGRALPNAELFRAAQAALVLAAAGVPALTFAMAAALGLGRRQAWAAAALAALSAFYHTFWVTTDAFALFALCAAGACLAHHRAGLAAGHQWRLAAGVLAGLAHLARADGVLVVGVLLLFEAWPTLRRQRPVRETVTAGLVLVGGYLLVMGPWLIRNLVVVGSPLAPNGTRALWLIVYEDLFTYWPERLTLERYLAQGLAAIARSKWEALVVNSGNLAATQANLIAFPFAVYGLWRLRGQPLAQRGLAYGAAVFAVMTFAFTLPGARGGYFHSGAALVPFLYPAAVLGLEAAVEAAARRLPHWRPERSKPVFLGLLVLGAAALTGFKAATTLAGRLEGNRPPSPYAAVGAWLLLAAGG